MKDYPSYVKGTRRNFRYKLEIICIMFVLWIFQLPLLYHSSEIFFWEIKRMLKEMLNTRSSASETFLVYDILPPLLPHHPLVPWSPLWGEGHTNGIESVLWYQVGSWCSEHEKKRKEEKRKKYTKKKLGGEAATATWSLSAALWIRRNLRT